MADGPIAAALGRSGRSASDAERVVVDGTARETAGVTTRLILAYIRRQAGDAGVARLLDLAGERRPVEELEDELGWSSYQQKVALFEAAEVVTGDPHVARAIGEALLAEQLGTPLRLVIGALGSPQQVLRSCARANARFSTNSTMEALESGPGRAVVTYRVDEGYRPSRHDCAYTEGVLSQASVLFGLPPARVVHEACQSEGARACRYEVTWQRRSRWPWRGRRTDASVSVQALEARLFDLEATVSDLISLRGLDEVLDRIAERAGAAVRGQRFLLVVKLDGEATPHVRSEGFEPGEATALGERLLETSGRSGGHGEDRLVAEVASSHRRYGYLATYLPRDKGFLPSEQGQLTAYARLAAAALDSATAVRDARRGERTAEAILQLAHAVAGERTEVAVARRIVQAVPDVIGCDRSSLLLQDETEGHVRVVAAHGYGELSDAAEAFEVVRDTPALAPVLAGDEAQLATRDHPDPWVRDLLARFDAGALAVAPIIVRGTFMGLLVADWARTRAAAIHEPTAQRALSGLADHAGVAIAGVRALEQAQHRANHDALTGLANRSRFASELERAIADVARQAAIPAAVCFLDLDGFKAVNDHHGHAAGDEVLVTVAGRLRARMRETDVVARISGDEFGILLRGLSAAHDATAVVERLIADLAAPIDLGSATIRVGVSIGLAPVLASSTPSALLRSADQAMYRAKAGGGSAFAWSVVAPEQARA